MVEIVSVTPGSPAARAGILPGDKIVRISGSEIRDVLDYRFYTTDTHPVFELDRDGASLTVELRKGEYTDCGLEFATPLMDAKHSCTNKCMFCFIDQLPSGMRDTLYFKDDDSRLSFLHGNYITMTNLSDADIDRIISMHMSPVNISVHTTNPQLRVRMMKNKRAGQVLGYMRRLADAAITLRAQIVLCPGINDGDELDRTLCDLRSYLPALDSVSVVPVGLTDHRRGLCPLAPFTPEHAAQVIRTVESFADECYREHGTHLVYCADEFYLKAGLPLPSEPYYEGYPQLENGVGMLRSLVEESAFALEDLSAATVIPPRKVTIATGMAAAPTLTAIVRNITDRIPGLSVDVVAVPNSFFGSMITVAGLLTATDICHSLSGRDIGDILLVPKDALKADEDIFLDDVTLTQLSERVGAPVCAVPDDGSALIDAILNANRTEVK